MVTQHQLEADRPEQPVRRGVGGNRPEQRTAQLVRNLLDLVLARGATARRSPAGPAVVRAAPGRPGDRRRPRPRRGNAGSGRKRAPRRPWRGAGCRGAARRGRRSTTRRPTGRGRSPRPPRGGAFRSLPARGTPGRPRTTASPGAAGRCAEPGPTWGRRGSAPSLPGTGPGDPGGRGASRGPAPAPYGPVEKRPGLRAHLTRLVHDAERGTRRERRGERQDLQHALPLAPDGRVDPPAVIGPRGEPRPRAVPGHDRVPLEDRDLARLGRIPALFREDERGLLRGVDHDRDHVPAGAVRLGGAGRDRGRGPARRCRR